MDKAKQLRALQGEMSDFHKDVTGFRPRWTEEQWNSLEFLLAERKALSDILNSMTPEQRKAEGWAF
jgi:hypothetical protein